MKSWTMQAAEKDVRALLPTWCLSAITMALAGRSLSLTIAPFAYLFGCTILGAMIIGHEYTHKTLGGLLTLPVGRHRLLLTKLAVLAVMIGGLAAIARIWTWNVAPDHASWMRFALPELLNGSTALLLPALYGLCIAPWFTMIGRSAMAGAVFASAMYCVMWFAGEVIGVVTFGQLPNAAADVRALRLTVMWDGTLAICAVSAVAAWTTFTRLQAADGGGVPIDFWRRFTPARGRELTPSDVRSEVPARPGHWIAKAAAKELRLQTLALIIAGLYAIGWSVIARSRPFLPEELHIPLITITNVYGGLVAIIIGAFASAEERHLGTSAWQGLMPVAMWKQFAVKVVTVLLLALALGAGVPKLLEAITPGVLPFFDKMELGQMGFVPVVALVSLYVSSFVASGLRALVASITTVIIGGSAVSALPGFTKTFSRLLLPLLRELGWFRHTNPENVQDWLVVLPISLMAIAVVLALRLALANHRSAERSWRPIRTQALLFSALFVASTVVLGAGEAAATRNWRYDGRTGVQLRGVAAFEGSSPQPSTKDLESVYVLVVPDDYDSHGAIDGVFKNGALVTPYFYPDQYTIRAWPTSKAMRERWTFKGATYQGRDVSETPIDIKTNIDGVVFTFTDHPGSVEGDVSGADGAGSVVLLFPVDPNARKDYGWLSRRVSAFYVPAAKHFTITMPPNGDYYLAAIPADVGASLRRKSAGWTGWEGKFYITNNPAELLEKVAPVAERIHAREGETITRTLTVQRPR